MRKSFIRVYGCERGAAAIEFAVVGMTAILFVFMTLEFTIALHIFLRTDEALRQAARTAVIQPAIADLQPLSATPIVCTQPSTSISCSGSAVTSQSSFTNIVTAAQNVLSDITPQMINVTYRSSGVGNAATLGGTQPIVSVSLSGYSYTTVILSVIGIPSIALPTYSITHAKGV